MHVDYEDEGYWTVNQFNRAFACTPTLTSGPLLSRFSFRSVDLRLSLGKSLKGIIPSHAESQDFKTNPITEGFDKCDGNSMWLTDLDGIIHRSKAGGKNPLLYHYRPDRERE